MCFHVSLKLHYLLHLGFFLESSELEVLGYIFLNKKRLSTLLPNSQLMPSCRSRKKGRRKGQVPFGLGQGEEVKRVK